MSSPDTNTRKEARRHWPPLLALLLVVVFGVGLILYWVAEEIAEAPDEDAPTTTAPSAQDVEDGDVAVPDGAPEREAEPEPLNPGTPEL